VTVGEEEIAAGVLLLLEREKTVAEPACAAGVAAVVNGHVPDVRGRNVVMVLSGGNIDVNAAVAHHRPGAGAGRPARPPARCG
jgi:threonine dehydratase